MAAPTLGQGGGRLVGDAATPRYPTVRALDERPELLPQLLEAGDPEGLEGGRGEPVAVGTSVLAVPDSGEEAGVDQPFLAGSRSSLRAAPPAGVAWPRGASRCSRKWPPPRRRGRPGPQGGPRRCPRSGRCRRRPAGAPRGPAAPGRPRPGCEGGGQLADGNAAAARPQAGAEAIRSLSGASAGSTWRVRMWAGSSRPRPRRRRSKVRTGRHRIPRQPREGCAPSNIRSHLGSIIGRRSAAPVVGKVERETAGSGCTITRTYRVFGSSPA